MDKMNTLQQQKQEILKQIAELQEELMIIEECIVQEQRLEEERNAIAALVAHEEEQRINSFLNSKKEVSATFYTLVSTFAAHKDATLKDIAHITNKSVSTIKKHLRELKENGLISTKRNRLEDGTFGNNSYSFTVITGSTF